MSLQKCAVIIVHHSNQQKKLVSIFEQMKKRAKKDGIAFSIVGKIGPIRGARPVRLLGSGKLKKEGGKRSVHFPLFTLGEGKAATTKKGYSTAAFPAIY